MSDLRDTVDLNTFCGFLRPLLFIAILLDFRVLPRLRLLFHRRFIETNIVKPAEVGALRLHASFHRGILPLRA
jgi:hypothetical protein